MRQLPCGTFFETDLQGNYLWVDGNILAYKHNSFMFWLKYTMKYIVKHDVKSAGFCLGRAQARAK